MHALLDKYLVRPLQGVGERFMAVYAAPLPLRLAVAGLVIGAATVMRIAVAPTLGDSLPYSTFYIAVEISALLGGLAPGLVAMLGSAFIAHSLFTPLQSTLDKTGLALFLATCAIFLSVTEVLHRARQELSVANARREASERADQLAYVALASPGVVGAFSIDANGHVAYRYASPKAKTVLGLDPAALCADARLFYKKIRPEDLPALNEALFQSARELSLLVAEFQFEHPDKGPVWIEAQATPVREADGVVVWHGYASDVTQRKRVDLSLAETAARLQATIDAAQDAVFTLDAEARIQTINRAGAAMFGRSAQELVGARFGELLLSAESDGGASLGEHFLDEGVDERREVQVRRKSGRLLPAELSLAEARVDGKRLIVAFVKDLTEQRAFARQLEEMHRDRLTAMGGMAAALAHEINQPLAATATYLRVARRLLDRGGDERAEISDILDRAAAQTLRAGRILTSLREVVRNGEADKTLLSMNDVVREAHDAFVANDAVAAVAMRLECRAVSDQVVADRSQLKQALGNLLRNAAEAMDSATNQQLVVSTWNPDPATIRVDVIDTGCGLPETSRDGCFAPFATTKEKAIGVGLSVSKSIIEEHYGRIWAEPNAGGGAVFSFTLPLQSADFTS